MLSEYILLIFRMIKTAKIETPLGEMIAGATDDGIMSS